MDGARTLDFRQVTKQSPCPICGGATWCAHTAEGPVRCMRAVPKGLEAPMGWRAGRQSADGGRMFIPAAGRAPSREDAAATALREAEKSERNRRRAARVWKDATPDTSQLRAYIAGRGINLAALPGGVVPKSLRFNPTVPDTYDAEERRWNHAPAMVGVVQGADRKLRGIHRTFLQIDLDTCGQVQKRSESAKKQLGPCSGGAVRLYSGTESGVLILTEGIETALACLQATGCATWSCLDAVKLQSVELPTELVGAGRRSSIAVVVIAGDLDANQAGQKASAIAANRLRASYPWLEVHVRVPSVSVCPQLVKNTDGGPMPLQGKGIDWLDALRVAGVDGVRDGLLGGIDIAAARDRAERWSGQTAAAAAESGTQAPTADRLGGVRLIDDSPMNRAELYLLENESPEKRAPARAGYLLRSWAGRWWEYDGRVWHELDPDVLRGRVWRWLDRFYVVRRGEQVPLAPTGRVVDDVLGAIRGLVIAEAEALPVWLRPAFDSLGRPEWDEATSHRARRLARVQHAGSVVAFQNCLLDVEAWAAGELRSFPHTPLFFSTTCLPFELPEHELHQAMLEQSEHALLGQLCPTWLRFLAGIYGDELEWHDTLQEWFGYNLIPDNRLEKMLLLVGPPRSGKGTILTALQAMLGAANVASLGLQNLTERFGLAELVGKLAAILPDAHLGRFTDGTQAVEVLKSITGNDPVRIEEKYGKRAASVKLPVRFTVACNEMPNLQDSSLALHGRTLVLKTERSHQGDEDTGLKSRILAEAPGITLWALLGLRRLWARKPLRLQQPASGAELLGEMAREQSPVTAFVEDECRPDPDAQLTYAQLYAAWERWCDATNRHAGSPETFSRKLRAGCPSLRIVNKRNPDGTRTRYYVGLALLAEPAGTTSAANVRD
jgi:putative DNA primase/helicase